MYTSRLHIHYGRCMFAAKQNRLTCLLDGSTSHSVRASAAGKEKGHLRPSHVSRESLWTAFRDTNAARHMLCRLSLLASRISTAAGVSDLFLKRSSSSARRDTSNSDIELSHRRQRKSNTCILALADVARPENGAKPTPPCIYG